MIITTATTSFAQGKSDFVTEDGKEPGEVVYRGELTFDDLKSFSWMQQATAYKPDTNAVNTLKQYLGRYELIVFLGTWCEDSHRVIPQLFSVLRAAGYPLEKVELYGVGRDKKARYEEANVYDISRVPIIILSKNHVIKGRIIESPEKNVETDLAVMIQKAEQK